MQPTFGTAMNMIPPTKAITTAIFKILLFISSLVSFNGSWFGSERLPRQRMQFCQAVSSVRSPIADISVVAALSRKRKLSSERSHQQNCGHNFSRVKTMLSQFLQNNSSVCIILTQINIFHGMHKRDDKADGYNLASILCV